MPDLPTRRDDPHAARVRALDLFRGGALIIALVILLAVLWTVRAFVLVLFFAVLLALPLEAASGYFNRRFRVPRAAGVAALVLATAGTLYGAGLLLASPIASQMEEVQEQLPQAVDRVEAWVNSRPFVGRVILGGREVAESRGGAQATDGPPRATGSPQETQLPAAGASQERGRQDSAASMPPSLRNRVAAQLREHAGTLFPFVMTTVTAISGVLLVIFLVIYLAADPGLYTAGVLRVVPERHRDKTLAIGRAVASNLKRWLAAQAVSMGVIAAITTLALFMLDVKAALALGILAGVSEFIPVFGPLISAIPALGIAFVDSPTKALYVLIAYVVIQQIESNIVSPLVMKRGVDVPPVVTILSGTVMTILFGFLGLLVAVPLAAALLTVGREVTSPVPEEQIGA